MTTRRRLERLPGPSAVAIGNFDGFHAGHRRIVETLGAEARRRRLASVLLSFRPHPRVFLGHAISLISTDAQRREALARQDADRLFFIDFASVAPLSARGFILDVLRGVLRMKVLVVGGDFRFGRDREGDLDLLRLLATSERFRLVRAPDVEIDGRRVASSLIRRRLAAGAIGEANRMLERPYFIDGIVERGAGRGREIGFPTMNIATENSILPRGVFHTRVAIAGREYPAVTNIGYAPTLRPPSPPPGASLKIETHVPGFSRTLYGRKVRLHFIDKIRDERRFAGAGELAAQIRRDIAALGI